MTFSQHTDEASWVLVDAVPSVGYDFTNRLRRMNEDLWKF